MQYDNSSSMPTRPETASLAGEPISKQTSFSRISAELDRSLQQNTTSAIPAVRNWMKNYHRLVLVRGALRDSQSALQSVLSVTAGAGVGVTASTFEKTITTVQSKDFLDSLSLILSILPRDPNVKLKQQALARVIASAVLICFHPGVILSRGDDASENPVPDTSTEAQNCAVSAKLLVNRLAWLLKEQSTGFKVTTIRDFRTVLVGYRFSCRHFIDALDTWKKLDADRMVLSMQSPYMFCYGAYLSALNSKTASSGADIDSLIDMSHKEVERIHMSMAQLTGKTRAAELQAAWQAEVATQMNAAQQAIAAEDPAGVSDASDAPAHPPPEPTSTASSPGRASKTGSGGVIGARTEQLLASLSGMMGLENDRLVHEICVNPAFRLPAVTVDPFKLPNEWHMSKLDGPVHYMFSADEKDVSNRPLSIALPALTDTGVGRERVDEEETQTELSSFRDMPSGTPRAGRVTPTVSSVSNAETSSANYSDTSTADPVSSENAPKPVSTQDMLKRSFMDILGDQMVASLLSSPLQALDNTLELGCVVPVVFVSNENSSAAMLRAPDDWIGKRPLYKFDAMSARISKLYYGEQELFNAQQPLNAAGDIQSVAGSAVGEGAVPIGGDVVYLADGGLERGVDFRSRLVLSSDPPSGRPFINALHDLTARLADTVPSRPDILNSLNRAIDADGLLLQMLSHRVATATDILQGSLQPLVTVLQSLQALDKSELTETWWMSFQNTCLRTAESTTDRSVAFNTCVYNLPAFFEFMSACVDDLRRDIANFYVGQLAVALQTSGPGYLGQALVTRCAAVSMESRGIDATSPNADSLARELSPADLFPNTYAMITSVLSARTPADGELLVIKDLNENAGMNVTYHSSEVGSVRETNKAVIASAFVSLLQVPYRLDTREALNRLPEVFSWDGKRLAGLRDQIDILSILSSIVLAMRQLQMKYGLTLLRSASALSTPSQKALDDWFDTLFHRLDALLHEPNINMDQIVQASCRFFTQLTAGGSRAATSADAADGPSELSTTAPNRLPIDWEGELTRSLRHVVTEGNPIMNLFFKRICRVVLAGILGGDYKAKLATYSLGSAAQLHALEDIITSSRVVFDLSVKAHGSVYTALLQQACAILVAR